MALSVWPYRPCLRRYGQKRVRFWDFQTFIYRLLHLQSEYPLRGWMHVFDALNRMALPVWLSGPWFGRYSDKRTHIREKTRRFNENLNNFMSSCPIRIIF